VTWRTDAEQSTGHVVILLTTPGFSGDTEPMRKKPGLKKAKDNLPQEEVRRVTSLPTNQDLHGLWLVTQEEHRREWAAPYPKNAEASASGDWRTPYLTNVDCGPVLVLDMSEEDTGLIPAAAPDGVTA